MGNYKVVRLARDLAYWLWERQMPGKGKWRLFRLVGWLNMRTSPPKERVR